MAASEQDRFARIASLAVLVGTGLFVLLRVVTVDEPASAAWLVVVPPLLAGAAWVFLRRRRGGDDLPRTIHGYTIQAPEGLRPPRTGELVARLEGRGYRIDVARLDEAGRAYAAPGPETSLVEHHLRLRERRAAAEAGDVVLRGHALEGGHLLILVEATDSGPGLYDELAQYLVSELAALVPDLELVATHKGCDRRPARTLGEGLPERPYGLALLRG